MRVLLVDVNAKQSSTGAIVYALRQDLERRGHTALLCYARGERYREPGLYRFALPLETALHGLLTRLTGFTDCFSPLSTLRLLWQIRRFRPDILHLHELHSYFLNRRLFWNYIKKTRIKVLWTMHCDIAFTGRCGVAMDCTRYRIGCGSCPYKNLYPKTLCFDHSAYMWRVKKALYGKLPNLRFSAPSAWLKDRLAGSFLGVFPCDVVPNGVDAHFAKEAPPFLRERLGIAGKSALTVVPSYYDESKGGAHFAALARHYEGSGLHFVIISRDYEGRRDLSKNLHALTGLSLPQLAAAYRESDVFLLLSSFETFSKTCAEALTAGTPVVGFASGAPERVFASPYAQFVPYGDREGLCQKLDALLESPLRREEIAAYAARFSESAMLEGYYRLYEEMHEAE